MKVSSSCGYRNGANDIHDSQVVDFVMVRVLHVKEPEREREREKEREMAEL